MFFVFLRDCSQTSPIHGIRSVAQFILYLPTALSLTHGMSIEVIKTIASKNTK